MRPSQGESPGQLPARSRYAAGMQGLPWRLIRTHYATGGPESLCACPLPVPGACARAGAKCVCVEPALSCLDVLLHASPLPLASPCKASLLFLPAPAQIMAAGAPEALDKARGVLEGTPHSRFFLFLHNPASLVPGGTFIWGVSKASAAHG